MEELAVIENLIEGNRAPLRVRRALACVSRFHAGALVRLFRQRVLHLAECDCTWPNYVFVRKRLQRAIQRLGGTWPSATAPGSWQNQLPVIQVEGERVLGPAIHTDEWYWNAVGNNWPLQLANVKKATIFFVSRALAELEVANASVGYATLVLPVGMVQNALPGIHSKLEQHQPLGPEVYQFLSGVAEVHALRETRIVMDMKHRMLDDDAVPNVAHHICKRRVQLQALNLSRTDPWYHCAVCLPRYLFVNTHSAFPKLHTLRLNCVFMDIDFLEVMKEALLQHRIPALQILDLRSVGLDDASAEILAPGLAAQQHTLRELALNDNQFDWSGLAHILLALKGSPTLSRLGVSGNPLSVGAVERMAQFIQAGNLPDIRQVDYYRTGQSYVRGHCAMSIALKCSKAQREWSRFVERESRGGTPLGHIS